MKILDHYVMSPKTTMKSITSTKNGEVDDTYE